MKPAKTILSLALATTVAGHGYLYIPDSRTKLGNEVRPVLSQPSTSTS